MYALARALMASSGSEKSAQRGAESMLPLGRKARVSRSQPWIGDCTSRISSALMPSK
jgi:hypothetical protein